jgi:hypothetical protein
VRLVEITDEEDTVNPYTGQHAPLEPGMSTADVAAALGCAPGEMVVVHGEESHVAELGRRVALGQAEIERRRARRKQQAASRRQNR